MFQSSASPLSLFANTYEPFSSQNTFYIFAFHVAALVVSFELEIFLSHQFFGKHNMYMICVRISHGVSLFLTFFANKCTIAVLLLAGGQFLFRGKLLAYLHDAYFALSSSFFAFQALETAAFMFLLKVCLLEVFAGTRLS